MTRRERFLFVSAVVFLVGLAGCDPASGWLRRLSHRSRPPVERPAVPRRVVPAAELGRGHERDAYGYPLVTVDAVEAVALVRSSEYSRATSLLRALQAALDEDFRNEEWLFDAYSGFKVTDPELGARLDEWCASEPESEAAWAARGVHRVGLGWSARGGHWASETSAEQFQAMEGHFGRARLDLQRALRLSPSLLVAHVGLMDIGRGGSDGALFDETYRLALAVEPLSFNVRRAYLIAATPRWSGSQGAMRATLSEWKPLFAKNPRLAVLQGLLVSDQVLSDDDADLKLELLDEALSYSHNALTYAARARAQLAAKRLDEALADADAAVAVNPNLAGGHYCRARALYGLGQHEEALLAVERAAELNPVGPTYRRWREKRAEDLVRQGHRLYVSGRTDDAVALLALAERFDPDSAKAAYWTGQVLLKAGRHEEALAHLEAAIALAPRDFDAHRSLDLVLARGGDWQRVIALWDAFLLREPDHAQAWLERAGAKKRSGDMDGALADLGSACELGSQEACAILARPGGR